MGMDIDRGFTPSPAWENGGVSRFGAAGLALSGFSGEVGAAGSGGARSMSAKGLKR